MRRLETRPLDSFNETSVDKPISFSVAVGDRSLSYEEIVGNTPAVTSSYDAVNNPQTVLGSQDGLEPWDESKMFPVGRLASFHGRNLSVLGKTSVEDSNGNEYHSLCIKGSDLSNPYLFKSLTAERDYIIHGLQESLVMERVIRASQVLRQNNIPTEYICGLALPENFPVDGEYQPLDIKNLKTLPEFLEHLSTRFAEESGDDDKSPLEIKADMIDRFKDCDYLVSYRAMDCPYRFSEISDRSKYHELGRFVVENYEGPDLEEYFDLVHRLGYIYRDFTPTLAHNVAKMHKLGLTHNFLTSQNITAMGSIVDLDSCRGEVLGLGDELPTDEDYFKDINSCLDTICRVINDSDPGYDTTVENKLARQEYKNLTSLQFLTNYLGQRYDNDKDRERSLASLLLEMKNGDEQSSNHTMSQLGWLFSSAHRSLFETEEDAEPTTPDLDTIKQKDRRDTFLGPLPVKYLREFKDQVLDDSWTMNQYHAPVSFNPDKPIYHPLRAALKNMAIAHFIDACQRLGHFDSKPKETFHTLGYFYVDNNNPDETSSEQSQVAYQYLHNQMRKIMDGYCEGETQPAAHSKLRDLLSSELKHYRDQTGQINLVDDNLGDTKKPNLDILWVENDSQYSEVFKALGITNDSQLSMLNAESYAKFNEEASKEYPDLVLLSHYKLASHVAEQVTKQEVEETILCAGVDGRSTVAVQGLSSGEPIALVFKVDDSENDHGQFAPKPNHGYEDLIEGTSSDEKQKSQRPLFTKL